MLTLTIFVATVALFTKSECAIPIGAHYGGGYGGGYDGPKYHGPMAALLVIADGHIADTHEVAAAKGAHLAAVSKAAAHSGYGGYDDGIFGGAGYGGAGFAAGYGAGAGYGGGYGAAAHGFYDGSRYHGPQAIPVVLPDGHIADTHEVAAAKGAHLAAVLRAQATSHAAGYGGGYDGSYAGGYGGYGAGGHGNYGGAGYGAAGYVGAGYAGAPYHGPLAKPVIFPSGYLAYPHDVAAVKCAHLSAVANAAHSQNGWAPNGGHGYF